VATCGYVLVQGLWLPPLLLTLDGGSLALRVAVTVAAIFPAGVLMG